MKQADEPSSELLRLLVLLLGAPDHDSLDLLRELSPTWPWLERCIEEAENTPLDAWQYEHTRLFISGYPHTVCTPFASAYRHGRLNGPVVDELRVIYDDIGLEAPEGFDDYLGSIFECLAVLIDIGDGERLNVFWREQLDPWVPRFVEDLRAGSRMLLYKEIAEHIAGLLALRPAMTDEDTPTGAA